MHRERYLHRLNVAGLRGREVPALKAGTPALLVLDMQDYFLSQVSHAFVPSGPDLIPRLTKLAELFESLDLPVVYTRHLNTADNAGMMGRWWRDILTADNPLSNINEAFDTSWSGVIEKTQYDAFMNSDLQKLLGDLGATTVVVTGVMTHLCCETTARAAFTRGYRVVFPVDCTATYNTVLHRATTLNMSHGFAEPVCGSAVMETVRNARG